MEEMEEERCHPWQLWDDRERKRLLFLVSSVGLLAPLTNTVVLPIIPSIQEDLDASDVEVSLVLSVYILFMAVGLLAYGVLSDKYGRRSILLISLVIHFIFSVLCGLAWNIWSLIAFRAAQAVGSCGTISAGIGVVSDIFSPERRGRAMGAVSVGPLVGPLIGPLLGGLSSEAFGWRAAFFFVAILSVVFFVIVFVWLKETLPSMVDPQANEDDIKKSHPLRALSLALMPKLIPYTLMGFITQGMLFICMLWVSFAFVDQYGMTNAALAGLAFSPFGAGGICGAFLGGFLADRKGRNYAILLFSPLLPPIMILFVYMLVETIHLSLLLTCSAAVGIVLLSGRVPQETVGIDEFPAEGSSVTSGMRTLQQLGGAIMMTGGVAVGEEIGRLETISILGFMSLCTTVVIAIAVYVRHKKSSEIHL